ncbi:hypothetical protein EIP91_006108 [Steccherinum ochraceum]|uniref:Uncharacterized protein n=1 Tax=Steccherinum ochraceum TaxID=92696 RepID=A0A4R0RTM8_9APHY|nr:hypothetical protein EIP91_006108 [Steccherinum ochraceum]
MRTVDSVAPDATQPQSASLAVSTPPQSRRMSINGMLSPSGSGPAWTQPSQAGQNAVGSRISNVALVPQSTPSSQSILSHQPTSSSLVPMQTSAADAAAQSLPAPFFSVASSAQLPHTLAAAGATPTVALANGRSASDLFTEITGNVKLMAALYDLPASRQRYAEEYEESQRRLEETGQTAHRAIDEIVRAVQRSLEQAKRDYTRTDATLESLLPLRDYFLQRVEEENARSVRTRQFTVPSQDAVLAAQHHSVSPSASRAAGVGQSQPLPAAQSAPSLAEVPSAPSSSQIVPASASASVTQVVPSTTESVAPQPSTAPSNSISPSAKDVGPAGDPATISSATAARQKPIHQSPSNTQDSVAEEERRKRLYEEGRRAVLEMKKKASAAEAHKILDRRGVNGASQSGSVASEKGSSAASPAPASVPSSQPQSQAVPTPSPTKSIQHPSIAQASDFVQPPSRATPTSQAAETRSRAQSAVQPNQSTVVASESESILPRKRTANAMTESQATPPEPVSKPTGASSLRSQSGPPTKRGRSDPPAVSKADSPAKTPATVPAALAPPTPKLKLETEKVTKDAEKKASVITPAVIIKKEPTAEPQLPPPVPAPKPQTHALPARPEVSPPAGRGRQGVVRPTFNAEGDRSTRVVKLTSSGAPATPSVSPTASSFAQDTRKDGAFPSLSTQTQANVQPPRHPAVVQDPRLAPVVQDTPTLGYPAAELDNAMVNSDVPVRSQFGPRTPSPLPERREQSLEYMPPDPRISISPYSDTRSLHSPPRGTGGRGRQRRGPAAPRGDTYRPRDNDPRLTGDSYVPRPDYRNERQRPYPYRDRESRSASPSRRFDGARTPPLPSSARRAWENVGNDRRTQVYDEERERSRSDMIPRRRRPSPGGPNRARYPYDGVAPARSPPPPPASYPPYDSGWNNHRTDYSDAPPLEPDWVSSVYNEGYTEPRWDTPPQDYSPPAIPASRSFPAAASEQDAPVNRSLIERFGSPQESGRPRNGSSSRNSSPHRGQGRGKGNRGGKSGNGNTGRGSGGGARAASGGGSTSLMQRMDNPHAGNRRRTLENRMQPQLQDRIV